MIALLLNHLWQSSLCVAGAGLMALTLHRNGANVRFWLWFAASVKFLVPFALLTALGATLLTPILPPAAARAVILIEPLAQPFPAMSLAAAPAATAVPMAVPPFAAPPPTAVPAVPAAAHLDLGSALLALWAAGFLIIAMRWLVRWSRVRALLREATAVQVDAPIAVKFSSSRLEPGLVGILRPVILLPQGIEQQLSAVELKAVLAHELCHWRRHDNLLAAIHMLVEALFWFFPLVWWLGARLNAERERACDESVLADGNDPQMYAEGILKVCRVYLQSPLACVAGVSGAGLKKRIDAIMENKLVLLLNAARKFVLGTCAAIALVLPLALGLAAAPVAQMQAKAAPTPNPRRSADDAATTRADLGLNERSRDIVPSQGTTPQSRSEALAKAETLAPPSPDLSRLLPTENLATPTMVASNDARTPNDQPAASVQPAARGSASLESHPSATAIEPIVMPDTPNGEGDPNTIVCRARQRIAGSGQFGPEACGHNYEWWNLAMNGKDLAPDGKTPIDRPTVRNPKGDGDPDTITCRTPQFIMRGPLVEVCRTNRFWADLIKNHQIVDAYGVVVQRPRPPYGGDYGPGNTCSNCSLGYGNGNGYGYGYDSGNASQSSAGSRSTQTYGGYTP
jgi:beta-lactamase regulating signal transducer with metallopeptidase domain